MEPVCPMSREAHGFALVLAAIALQNVSARK
jgi:hypothetical protein